MLFAFFGSPWRVSQPDVVIWQSAPLFVMRSLGYCTPLVLAVTCN